MTDSEKIDLILSEIQDMKKDINNLKRQVIKSTAELKAMDEIINFWQSRKSAHHKYYLLIFVITSSRTGEQIDSRWVISEENKTQENSKKKDIQRYVCSSPFTGNSIFV